MSETRYGYQPSHHLVPHRETVVPLDRQPLWDEEEPERPLTIEEKFQRFHAAHPEVYRELVRLARQAKEAGRTRLGMKQLFEVLRWNYGLQRGDEEYKLNNIFTSHFSRLIMVQEPDLDGIFETRRLLSD